MATPQLTKTIEMLKELSEIELDEVILCAKKEIQCRVKSKSQSYLDRISKKHPLMPPIIKDNYCYKCSQDCAKFTVVGSTDIKLVDKTMQMTVDINGNFAGYYCFECLHILIQDPNKYKHHAAIIDLYDFSINLTTENINCFDCPNCATFTVIGSTNKDKVHKSMRSTVDITGKFAGYYCIDCVYDLIEDPDDPYKYTHHNSIIDLYDFPLKL
jgi:hypothetical protein